MNRPPPSPPPDPTGPVRGSFGGLARGTSRKVGRSATPAADHSCVQGTGRRVQEGSPVGLRHIDVKTRRATTRRS